MDELTSWLRERLDEHERMVDRMDMLGEQNYPGWDWQRGDIAAKRAILDEHAQWGTLSACRVCDPGEGRRRYPCTTVRLLAQVYASEPGYREEWRP